MALMPLGQVQPGIYCRLLARIVTLQSRLSSRYVEPHQERTAHQEPYKKDGYTNQGPTHFDLCDAIKRASTPDDSSSSDDDEELDPNVGIAKVNWEMSMALEAVVARENIQVSRFCSYTETQFRKHLIQVFDFERHNQVIDELSTRGGFSFDETQRRAAQSERVYFTLTSRDAVIVEETISAPSAAISAPNGFQEADDVSNRRLAWTAMVEYAKYTNANRLDLSVPLWKYQFLRSMGRGCNEFEVENVILRFDGQFDEHLALQVCRVTKQNEPTLTVCSTPTI
jgi:hypothetical protein